MSLDDSGLLNGQQNLQNKVAERITQEQVKAYLLAHPNFLSEHPELLANINVPHEPGEAASLVERQVKVLRERNQLLQGQLIDMLCAADANEKLLMHCNQFMLSLLEYDDLTALCQALLQKLKQEFALQGAALVLVGQAVDVPFVHQVNSATEIKERLNCQFPDRQPLCGRLSESARQFLFGDLSQQLQSFALIPLGENCNTGLLALASDDPLHFRPELGTLFIELIANLVSHLLRSKQGD
jgi:hypothetical protein